MQNNIQNVRTRNQDGSYSDLIPIGAKASNVILQCNKRLYMESFILLNIKKIKF